MTAYADNLVTLSLSLLPLLPSPLIAYFEYTSVILNKSIPKKKFCLGYCLVIYNYEIASLLYLYCGRN